VSLLRLVPAGVLGAVLVLTGCSGDGPSAPDLESRVDIDTPELRDAKQELGMRPCPAPSGPGSELPVLTLGCLGGGRDVQLSELSGPAVIQLWASWCGPCKDELPLFQRLEDEHGDELTIFGIDWQDTQPGNALTLLELTGATMPQLADPGGELAEHYRLTGLPGILLVDAQGAVTFKLMRIDSYEQLLGLVEEHVGLAEKRG
jgi:thiol-disulfide isomerase/thioredoxin